MADSRSGDFTTVAGELARAVTALPAGPGCRCRSGQLFGDRLTAEPGSVVRRCSWAEGDPLMRAYHDEEWGVPERDSRTLWEALMLDGFQAGLSWSTILRKRPAFRAAFDGFDPGRVARFPPAKVARLMDDPGIVRSRAKIRATIEGARIYLAMRDAGEDFSGFVWGIAGGSPTQNSGPVPAKSPLSEKLSSALKARGFKFVGPVIVYAWMQATGIVNDHSANCFRRVPIEQLGRSEGRARGADRFPVPASRR